MSNRFPYTGENPIIIKDGSIIWNDQSHDQSSLQYMDANDTIINESTINESYVTATDSNETTQYFSILESSNDITLEDLHNLTIGNVDAQENIVIAEDSSLPGQESKEDGDETEVLVFTIDGSDDLYGIQFSQDEEGNTQKYQFKFRSTSDGQLEAIPETIQLLPSDDEPAVETHIEQDKDPQSPQHQQYFLVQEQEQSASPSSNQEFEQEQDQVETAEEESHLSHEHVYIKGERHSPVEFEESVETECYDQEQSTGFDQQEAHTERIIENIKTEMIDRTVSQSHNGNLHISSDVYIKQEHYEDYTQENEQESEVNDETLQHPADNEEQIEQPYINIKQQTDDEVCNIPSKLEISEESVDEAVEQEEIDEHVENQLNQEELVHQYMNDDNCQIEVEFEADSQEQERASQKYQMQKGYEVQDQGEYSDDCEEPTLDVNNDSDSEQYEIVEGLHVTGELNEEPPEQIENNEGAPAFHEVIERYEEQTTDRTNILKHPQANKDKGESVKKPFVSVKYYVVYPEKENVNSLAGNTVSQLPVPKSAKPNPRSVLRTSFMKPKEPAKLGKASAESLPECDLFHKRFSKNKEAMRAKLFHYFLNRTTIPHAPVRQQRQPRKQEIKPVIERSDEEIIVQQVMVSSSGYIESLNQKLNKNLQVTAVVELSDSDEESNLQTNKHNRKTHHIPRPDSESEITVIEINSDEETNKDSVDLVKRGKGRPRKLDSSTVTLKRRRGRPPKKNKLPLVEAPIDLELSPSKRNCLQSEDTVCDNKVTVAPSISEINIEKKEIACPKCPKTFPSQNSLNTHIIHHNLENSLKNKAKMNSRPSCNPRQSLLPKLEYNHKCESCQQTFKNSILLQRHNCGQKPNINKKLNCSVCLKQFRDVAMLNMHKKIHVKSNLVSNTSVAKVSPKKSIPRLVTSLYKSPKTKSIKKVATNVFKCGQCSKVCESEQSLAAHNKLHKKFLCSSCSATFSSRILLDTHVRTNCVKIKSPLNKRLSFKIRKSFVHTPPKRLSTCKLNQSSMNNTTLNQSTATLKLECEICQAKFSTFRSLYTHKVQKHGLNTPDKSLLAKPKKTFYKPKAAHGGIPANDRMKKAYAALRQKLAEMHEMQNEGNSSGNSVQ